MNNPRLVKLVESKKFSYFIISVILLNAILIGVEITHVTPTIYYIQKTCLFIFIIEIFLRWFGRVSTKKYINDWWNWFDIFIILISLLPQTHPDSVGIYSAFRIIRVFRVLRLFKVFPSMGRMILVLVRSLQSIVQAIFLLFIFMYLYGLVGVIMFKDHIIIHNINLDEIDPFGNIGEALFSLFRVTTGEDWTDLRYDLMEDGISNAFINIYFVTWMILSAFLLLNIIIGAVVNNYDNEFNKDRTSDLDHKLDTILSKLEALESK
jgi:voltage-gated sodium channel